MQVSKYDKRTYQHYTMPNGLRILLVRDADCKKSAVAVSIKAGHFNDPSDACGLAHLLEHVIFNGSRQYPEADGFNKFLGLHGGTVNAWTATEHTNYHFDVFHPELAASLPRFADMLFEPLFEQSAIEKEVNAIDSEYKLKVNDDLRRLYQVHKETCNPQHPFSKFSVGNAKSFAKAGVDNLRDALFKLHGQCYVARNMSLCLISPFEFDQVKVWLADAFGCKTTNTINKDEPLPPLYLSSQLGVKINIRPIKTARRLIVSFAMPDMHRHYPSKPLEFISHVLGDEGQGSLLAYLKRRDWATNLTAGGGINGSNFKDFNINMQLTKNGQKKLESVLNALFYSLTLIAKASTEQWRLEEKAKLNQLAFDFFETGKPIDEAVAFSNQIFHYPESDILSGEHLITDTNPSSIGLALEFMHPNNMRLKYICPDAVTDQVADWYHTPYKIEPLAPDFLHQLSHPSPVDEIQLPEPNPYIVDTHQLIPIDSRFLTPKKILDCATTQIWFAHDEDFNQPKGDCFLSFDCQAVTSGTELSAHKRIWIHLLAEHLNDQFYRAGLAGLHYHLYPHQGGFALHTSGFSDKQLDLCLDIFAQLHADIDLSHMFEQVKHKQLNNLQNSLMNKPINRLFTRLSGIVQRFTHPPSELIDIVQQAQIEDIYAAREALLADYYVEGFVFGNWSYQQAKDFARKIHSSHSQISASQKIKRDVVDLKHPQGFRNETQCQHPDAAVVAYFQTPSAANKDIALTILLEQIIAAPFFHQMRHEKQLGYLAGSGYFPLNQHPGMAFYVQSPNFSARQIHKEMISFLHDITSDIDDLEAIWQQVKNNVVKQLVEKDTNLTAKSQRFWLAIGNEEQDFYHHHALVDELTALQFDELKAFCRVLFDSAKVGNLVLFSPGNFPNETPASGQLIGDLSDFKSKANFII